jgi:Spy/CpxP family protein refolding chaperone
MSDHIRRFGLGVGAALMALGLAAGVIAGTQHTSAQGTPLRGDHTGVPPMRLGALGPMGPMGLAGHLVERLGLSDTQKDSVNTIMQAHAADFKALAERIGAARRGLEEAMMTDPIDDAVIRQKSAELGAVDADMAVAGAHVRAEVFEVLTPEQRDQAKTLAARRLERGAGARR